MDVVRVRTPERASSATIVNMRWMRSIRSSSTAADAKKPSTTIGASNIALPRTSNISPRIESGDDRVRDRRVAPGPGATKYSAAISSAAYSDSDTGNSENHTVTGCTATSAAIPRAASGCSRATRAYANAPSSEQHPERGQAGDRVRPPEQQVRVREEHA